MLIVSQNGTRMVNCKCIWIEKLIKYSDHPVTHSHHIDYQGYLWDDDCFGKGYIAGYRIVTAEVGEVARFETLEDAKRAIIYAAELEKQNELIRFEDFT